MKQLIFIPIFFLLLMLNQSGQAQQYSNKDPILPLKTNRSVLFGKDIIINDQSLQNQSNASICTAFNGWLFTAHSYTLSDGSFHISMLKSTDKGISWEPFSIWDLFYNGLTSVSRIEIIANGNDLSNLKVFLGIVYKYTNLIENFGHAKVNRYNGNTGAFEVRILDEDYDIHDLALASDYSYPANNSNPYSISVLYSRYSGWADSIIFRSSSNGGNSFDTRRVVAVSQKHFNKVALCYGICPTYNGGRYFAAWEEKDEANSSLGHIYTAHSSQNYNSEFTAPKCLDSLDVSMINQCRNPVIACQVNNIDNDSANLTEIVLFEKQVSATNIHDIVGCYNVKAGYADQIDHPLPVQFTALLPIRLTTPLFCS